MIAELDLTPRQKQAVMLYYGEERRVEDIADLMGFKGKWPHTGVSQLLRRIRKTYPSLTRRYHRRDFDPFADA